MWVEWLDLRSHFLVSIVIITQYADIPVPPVALEIDYNTLAITYHFLK